MALCALAWALPAQAQTIVLFERDADAELADALRVELNVSGLVLDRVPAAMAEPRARAQLASDRGALAAVWVEDSPSAIAIAVVHDRTVHHTRLADGAEPRVRALVAASAIDDLLRAADDASILAEPTSVDASAPSSTRGYHMLGRLIEERPDRGTLLAFYGQLSSGPGVRGSDRAYAPIAARLDAGWQDLQGVRLGFSALMTFDAFERTMPLTITFGLTAGARFFAGPVPLTLGASITGGSGTIPNDPRTANTTAIAGAHFSAGIPVDRAFDLVARTDAALIVRQDSLPAFLGSIALGIDWH
jgi:hypothetical protein